MILQYAFNNVKHGVENNCYEIVVVGCVVFLILVMVFRFFTSTEDGTWTKKKYYELLPVRETTDYKPPPSEAGDSKGEIECRRVLNNIFDRPFHKDRPNFLNNPVTGGKHNLELDCVDHELKIAVEYNGAQHYKFIPHFHKSKQHFQAQMYRDDMKRRMCKDEGYTLIEVPYTLKIKEIDNFIKTELSTAGKI
jgi:hypothetical protein